MHSSGVSTLTQSTVSDNTAMVSGGVSNHGVLTLANSTISGNFANSRGGGVFNNAYAMMTVTNSTISGNTADNDGGGVSNSGILHLSSSTVSGNSAAGHSDSGYEVYLGKGGGVLNSLGTLTLVQTLVSGNSAASRGAEVYHYSGEPSGAIIANGFNLFGHDGDAGIGGFVPGVTDIVPAVPLAGILDPALADNGGPTKTHTLVTGSPAIDAVPAASCATTGDQSGVMRPQDGDLDTVADCDIGALETRIPAPAPPGATPVNQKPRLRCTPSVCRVLLRCDPTQGSAKPCNSAVNLFVRADASRLAGDRAAPKRIKFAPASPISSPVRSQTCGSSSPRGAGASSVRPRERPSAAGCRSTTRTEPTRQRSGSDSGDNAGRPLPYHGIVHRAMRRITSQTVRDVQATWLHPGEC